MRILTTTVARVLFSIPFLAFGLLHIMNAQTMAPMVPVPGGAFWIYFTGLCLLAGGLSMATGILGKWGSFGIAALMLVFVATLHIPGLSNPQMQQLAMTGLLKDLGLCGGALTWAGIFARGEQAASSPALASNRPASA